MLFSDKKDIRRDNLEIKFDPREQIYKAYLQDGTLVTNLTGNSIRILGKMNKELLLRPELLAKEMRVSIDSLRVQKLKDLGYACTSFEVLFSERDNDTYMTDEMKSFLENLTSEDDVLIGVHRTGRASIDDIAYMLRGGITMTRLNGSTTNSAIHLMNNVSYYPNNETIIKELVNADSYKDSLGSILIRIPDDDLSKNIFLIDSETCDLILDPQYIVGFVPVEVNGISEIITPYPPENGPFRGLNSLYEDKKYVRDSFEQITTGGTKK